jgi:hypothetical protein
MERFAKGFAVSAFVFNLCISPVFASFLPENNLHLKDSLKKRSNVTEEMFNEIIDRGVELYKPIVEAHGADLQITRRWEDATVNASAMQYFGSWVVNMYGGLARRDEITPDGFTLVVCHELGHHLGGFPFASGWAANEGQSDYFGTLSCLRRFWIDDVMTNATFRDVIPETPKAACDSAWESEVEQNLCYRMVMAGKSTADLLGALGGTAVSFDTRDANEVSTTNHRHPAGQCRLDTYIAGATCTATFDIDVIPGKVNGSGRNNEAAEREAAVHSCTALDSYTAGLRPRCWFAPRF